MKADILTDNEVQLLISIISPIGYIVANEINNKSAQEVLKALKSQINFFKFFDKKVRLIVSDSESAIKAIKDDLMKEQVEV